MGIANIAAVEQRHNVRDCDCGEQQVVEIMICIGFCAEIGIVGYGERTGYRKYTVSMSDVDAMVNRS